jgi:ATP-binding cassette, subfamily B, putative efflux pump
MDLHNPPEGGRLAGRIKSSPLVRFLSFIKPHLRFAGGAGLMGIAKFTLPLVFPLAFKYIIDVLLLHQVRLEPTNAIIEHWCTALAVAFGFGLSAVTKLGVLGAVVTLLFALQAFATYFSGYWSGIAGNRMILDLRYRMFRHLQRLSHSFFDRNPSGSVASRFITDVELAQNLVGTALTNVWMDAAALGSVISILFFLDHRLAAISLCVIPFYVVLIRRFSPRIRAASRQVQHMLGEFSGDLQEQVAGMGMVKSFGREEHVAARFYEQTAALHDRTLERVRLSARQQMYSEFLTRIAPLVVVSSAALMILGGGMTLGTMVAFIGFLGYLYQPLERFCQLSAVVSASMAAIERIFEFLDIEPEVVDRPGARELEVSAGGVTFENLTFGYRPRNGDHTRTVLRGIDLTVEGGKTIALVGRSGAGKTTLASLLARFYDTSAGRVLIDGQDVRDVSLGSLRDTIGIVTQDTQLFSTTIRENLLFGKPDANDAELWSALEQANIRSFVAGLPDGLDTVIAERGVKLSGGQRQRLALARAFLKNPPILILDEATSALDSESENLIRDAVARLMAGRTSFLIAHRLAMAVAADLIVVLDSGEIVETGTHEELLRAGGLYAALFFEQARGLVPQSHELPDAASRPSHAPRLMPMPIFLTATEFAQ